MDHGRWGLTLATAGLVAAFVSQIPASDGLLVLAYALTGAGSWLLVRDRAPAWVGMAGGSLLAVLALMVVVRQELVVGFRGQRLAELGLVLGGPAWDALLVLPPFAVVGVAVLARTSGWSRYSSALSLGLAGLTALLATGILPVITVGNHVIGGALLFVLVPLLAALAPFGHDLRSTSSDHPDPAGG